MQDILDRITLSILTFTPPCLIIYFILTDMILAFVLTAFIVALLPMVICVNSLYQQSR